MPACQLYPYKAALSSFMSLTRHALVQIKKIRNLVSAFDTFESISANPGRGEFSRLELQVNLPRNLQCYFLCSDPLQTSDFDPYLYHSSKILLHAGVAAKTRKG